jgi:hypothetical protein
MLTRLLLLSCWVGFGAGCVYWQPHSLVASDRPIREAVLVGKRISDRVCNHSIFGVPYGDTKASIDDLLERFHDVAPQAVAFQDIRFDEVLSVYVVYSERCLVGSVQPVYPVPVVPGRAPTGDRAPPAAASPTSEPPKSQEEMEQELLGLPKK